MEALKGMPNQLKIAEYIYLEVNFEEVYLGCSQIKDIDNFLFKFGFVRVGLRKTNKGWGDAIYSKNDTHILNLANNGQSSSLLEFGTHKRVIQI